MKVHDQTQLRLFDIIYQIIAIHHILYLISEWDTPEIYTLLDLMKRIKPSNDWFTLHHNQINISVISHSFIQQNVYICQYYDTEK